MWPSLLLCVCLSAERTSKRAHQRESCTAQVAEEKIALHCCMHVYSSCERLKEDHAAVETASPAHNTSNLNKVRVLGATRSVISQHMPNAFTPTTADS